MCSYWVKFKKLYSPDFLQAHGVVLYVCLGLVLLVVVSGAVTGVAYKCCRRGRRSTKTPPLPSSNDVNGHDALVDVNGGSSEAAVGRPPIQTPTIVNNAATSSNSPREEIVPPHESGAANSPRESNHEQLSRWSYIEMNGRPIAPFERNPRAKDLTAWRCYENSAHEDTYDSYVVAEPLENRSRSPDARI